MERSEELEFEYAERLRSSTRDERKTLYEEAYSVVSEVYMAKLASPDPEKRTAGTYRGLAEMLARVCRPDEKVLEVGCGRGYTCMVLAPYVKEIVGVDVSEPSLDEARRLMRQYNIDNAQILKMGGDELQDHFSSESFDTVISIDVYEHLHPEDGLQHLKDVYAVLKPKGKYIIVSPNQIDGPHDITKDIYPDAKQAMGFHLNETTKCKLTGLMREIGFKKFRSGLPLASKAPWLFDVWYPARLDCCLERVYGKIERPGFLKRLLRRFLAIRMMAVK